ncbi:hypothetical protein TrRE_jg11895 [Triparma retinervis]|uniref:Guanylate cyclase domain-containing protein n=1 Tax=Triparma retinervis TaxID=2557542 RepID=A0A9W7DQ68_9STRA|nr:hypothetical protein TrRE_jg11895 [Triparma retinervis]
MSELSGGPTEGGAKHTSLQQVLADYQSKRGGHLCPTLDEAKEETRWFLDHWSIKISVDDIMMVVTLFVLFGTDFRLGFTDAPVDDTFEVLNSIAFFLFLIELLLNSWAKTEFFHQPDDGKGRKVFRPQGYFGSFFFYLDLIALWSIIFEVEWLEKGSGMTLDDGNGNSGSHFRATRVVRMIRLVRLVKLYKVTSQRRREKKMLEDLRHLVDQGRMSGDEIDNFFHKMQHQKQSKVGTDLVDMITRKVIVCVLSMLLLVPLLTLDEQPLHFKHSTLLFNDAINSQQLRFNNSCESLKGEVDSFINTTFRVGVGGASPYYLLDLKVTDNSDDLDTCGINDYSKSKLARMIPLHDYDLSERTWFLEDIKRDAFLDVQTAQPPSGGTRMTEAVFSTKLATQEGAQLQILLTLFVIVVLISMAVAFENDAQQLVLSPIEQMMEMISMVADDPLEEFEFADMGGTGEYELKVVALAIQKITSLLRIGFGVAGAEIISKNMSVEHGQGQGLDPMIPGKRMYAIFGFCDIHEFDMCTEVLEDEIMTFVNSVARIVHEQVTRWGGTCNKNLGNAFLMIWRIGDEDELGDSSARRKLLAMNSKGGIGDGDAAPAQVGNSEVDLRRVPGLDVLSDKALFGFLKVVVEINRDRAVLAYRSDVRLKHGDQDFKLRMGFGLHAGWAIEGAVGSLQKVDATYLSPHVNMAARMEAASRQFGVAILMTEKFHELMSNDAQSVCRRLDVVTVKGSAVPMPIYTYDTLQNQVFAELQVPKNTDLSLAHVLKKQADNYSTLEWAKDQDLIQLRKLATKEFNEKFKSGIDAYLASNWAKARSLLEECDAMMMHSDKGGDGPSQTILNYMRNRQWICPKEWDGYRPLTSK